MIVDPDERVALVKHTYGPYWYLPGGGVKKGESCDAAVLRELREEVAFTAPRIERILGLHHNRGESKDDHVVTFVFRTDDPAKLRAADANEIEELRWFPIDALPADISPATRRRITEYREGITGLGQW